MKPLLITTCVVGVVLGASVTAQSPNDWPTVGNDPGGSKFSPLTQISPANVSRLTKAWTYDLGTPSGYTVTPIAVNNTLYFPVGGSTIVALKADAGTEVWKFDLKSLTALGTNPSAGGRGISYWPGDGRAVFGGVRWTY